MGVATADLGKKPCDYLAASMRASTWQADLNITYWQSKGDLDVTCMTMLQSSLPLEIIIQITDYLHITDIVKFSRASSCIHSYCE